jgi:deoxyribose-phosphate aldolase
MDYTREQILSVLDIAVLRPAAPLLEIQEAAIEVERQNMASVCVTSANVAFARRFTKRVCAVVGFPHGNTLPQIKAVEAQNAIKDGAVEIDFVLNYGHFLSGDIRTVEEELQLLSQTRAEVYGCKLKAILETCYYHPSQIATISELCISYGMDFIKTSTGFGLETAIYASLPDALQVILNTIKKCNSRTKVKASGGIRSYADACKYLDMGCTRLGVSYQNYENLLP